MQANKKSNRYFIISLCGHAALLLVFVLGFDFSSPLPVFENTNKNDVISAVVLGDTAKSKILPVEKTQPTPKETPPPKPVEVVKPAEPKVAPKKEVVAVPDKKKIALEKKHLETKKRQAIFADDLLADIKKVSEKQKKIKKTEVQSQFQKMLREQAEKSLRQDLLNEEIKIQGIKSRQAQGEVDKYKALIIQSISEHWLVPSQVNKKLVCQLMIRVAPGGMVLDVQVTKTSGDPSLDSSARAAVLKASPLPVPTNPDAFEAFRQFTLKVKPENLLS